MIAGDVVEPPRLVAPAPYQVSFGRVEADLPAGTVRVVVTVDGKIALARSVRRRHLRAAVELPRRDVTVGLIAIDRLGQRTAARRVAHVFGLPRQAAPRPTEPSLDTGLSRQLLALVRRFGSTTAFYVQDLRTGAGAAWNARARLPAASTLKLAIAVETLRSQPGPPQPGSRLDTLLKRLVIDSSNRAANELEVLLGGSTSGGSARVDALLAALGLMDSEMYGGYELEEGERRLVGTARPDGDRAPSRRDAAIPVRTDEQPSWGPGKYTTAFDLARLARAVHLAAGGTGPLSKLAGTFSAAEARYLLYLMLHSSDRGKLDRFLGPGTAVAHKAGWIGTSRHDSGVVYTRDGAFVATVMTFRAGGVGASSDELAGRIAHAAARWFRVQSTAARRQAAS